MTEEKIEAIFRDIPALKWSGDNAYKGLQILSKYTDNLICGADHDIIYSEGLSELVEAGITEDDIVALAQLNWMVEEASMACFV